MTIVPHWFCAVSGSLLLGLALAASAEQQSLQATIPWDAEGQLFQIRPDTILFMGSLEGIIYVETEKGELNEGFVECPLTQRVEMKTQATSGSGHCMITVRT